MKIAIIGTGGVGGYFGAKLANAGFDVSFLARGEHLAAIRKNGLTVKSIEGDFVVENANASDVISELGMADLVIIGVKAWQLKEVSKDVKEIIHSESIILPLQNGILAADELAEVIDRKNILGGLCRIISKIDAPGVINHFAVPASIVFGELDCSLSARTENIRQIFEKSGIKAMVSKNIEADLWKKYISICMSGLLAVTKTNYGELRELKETRELMVELLTEIYELSQKIGVNIEADFVEKTVSLIDTIPHNSNTSLARDVWEGKPSEIEYQNGTVVRLGKKYGIETPVNRFVYNCILPGELKARKILLKDNF